MALGLQDGITLDHLEHQGNNASGMDVEQVAALTGTGPSSFQGMVGNAPSQGQGQSR